MTARRRLRFVVTSALVTAGLGAGCTSKKEPIHVNPGPIDPATEETPQPPTDRVKPVPNPGPTDAPPDPSAEKPVKKPDVIVNVLPTPDPKAKPEPDPKVKVNPGPTKRKPEPEPGK